jgi:hypothetical protein
MVDVAAPSPATTSSRAVAPGTSFVEWSAVLAGAVLAVAISFVLLTFGTAIGLSATSPWPNSGLSAKVIASIAVFWAMAQQIGAFMVGGYVAGRMRSRWHESGHEADFRDGLHGGLVWAVGVVIGAVLFLSAAGSAAKTGAEMAGGAAAAGASSGDPMGAVLDAMVRPTNVAQAPAGAATGSATTPSPTPGGAATTPDQRARAIPGNDPRSEMSRVLTSAVANGSLTSENRAYLAQLVAQRAGISQQDAERRVDQAFASAREAADKARRGAVLTGFVTAAGLLISLAAAWWASVQGGNHRDNSVPARFVFGDPRRRTTNRTT